MATLDAGVSVVINQRVSGQNTAIYPITKTANVKDAQGNNLDTIVEGLAKKDHGNHVPDFSSETTSSLKFLRNDNTWAEIQTATTEQAGVVTLSTSTNLNDDTVAATASAVRSVKEAVDNLNTNITNGFVSKNQLGASTTADTTGVATLDENGHVVSTQLPSYVDDVVDIELVSNTEAKDGNGEAITPESGKIYIDDIGESASNKTYRWSGTQYVVISETLALGETSSTAFDGLRGKAAYDHSQADHARTDATLTEKSDNNGYIKINGTDTLVYSHPGTGTNPHGTTASDVGLGKVENLSASEVIDTLTKDVIVTKLGYTPQDASVAATSTSSGVMSASQAAKLDKCLQAEVVAADATPTISDGIIFQVVSE